MEATVRLMLKLIVLGRTVTFAYKTCVLAASPGKADLRDQFPTTVASVSIQR